MPRKKVTNPQPLPDYPKVKNAPAGYPHLLGIKGRTWYERARNYEKLYNKRVEPTQKGESNVNS